MTTQPHHGLALIVLLAQLLLGGCQQQTPMTSRPQLQALERPLLELNTPQDQRLLIPQAAVTERAGIPMVFVLQQGEARARMIKSGKRIGQQLEIISGLMGDETLVLGPFDAVHDGSPILRGTRQGR